MLTGAGAAITGALRSSRDSDLIRLAVTALHEQHPVSPSLYFELRLGAHPMLAQALLDKDLVRWRGVRHA